MSASSSTLGLAAAFAVALAVGGSVPALADPPPDPAEGQVWGGCVLHPDTIAAIQADVNVGIAAPSDEGIEVAFVVVYALKNDNDGQPLFDDSEPPEIVGYTGPVICRNDDEAGIETTTQDADIPDPVLADSVDTLDVEDVFILRYVLNGGGEGIDGTNEKVVCHTVDSTVDCFRISPLLIGGID